MTRNPSKYAASGTIFISDLGYITNGKDNYTNENGVWVYNDPGMPGRSDGGGENGSEMVNRWWRW